MTLILPSYILNLNDTSAHYPVHAIVEKSWCKITTPPQSRIHRKEDRDAPTILYSPFSICIEACCQANNICWNSSKSQALLQGFLIDNQMPSWGWSNLQAWHNILKSSSAMIQSIIDLPQVNSYGSKSLVPQ